MSEQRTIETVADRLRRVYAFAQPEREAREIEKLCAEAAARLENCQKQVECLRAQRDKLYERISSWQEIGSSGCRFYADIGNRTPWCKKCGEHLYDH